MITEQKSSVFPEKDDFVRFYIGWKEFAFLRQIALRNLNPNPNRFASVAANSAFTAFSHLSITGSFSDLLL